MTATSDKKTPKREKWNRPVSKKFYDFVHFQIRCAQCVSEDEEVRVDVMMARFDEYIEKGTVEVDFNNTEHVVFTLLQPYIDQAVARSRRAREAAARRRAARQAAEAPKPEPTEASESDLPTATQGKADNPRVDDTAVGTCQDMSPNASCTAEVTDKQASGDIPQHVTTVMDAQKDNPVDG